MRIAVYVPEHVSDNFIVQTLLGLIKLQPKHAFIFITSIKELFLDQSSNTDVISVRPASKNQVMQKLWWNRQLSNTLKKINADLFISINGNTPFPLSIPQTLLITDIGKAKIRSVKQFQSVIVTNRKAKEVLIQQHLFPAYKVSVVYPYAADNIFRPVDTDQREVLKKQYSDGSEFFLYYSSHNKLQDLIHLLKAFSHFKKRQQSGFKLLLLLESDPAFKESLESYKYRNDVKFIRSINKQEQAMIIGSAYALVLPFNNQDPTMALSSMQAGVPVISGNNSVMKEIDDKAAAYVGSETTKDLGEQMIRLYTNENFRQELIIKGKQVAQEFTLERSANSLWSAIMTALA